MRTYLRKLMGSCDDKVQNWDDMIQNAWIRHFEKTGKDLFENPDYFVMRALKIEWWILRSTNQYSVGKRGENQNFERELVGVAGDHGPEGGFVPESFDRPDTWVEDLDERELVSRAVDTMDEKFRVFVEYIRLGYSDAEISREMKISHQLPSVWRGRVIERVREVL